MNHSIGVTMKFAGFAAGGSDHPRTPRGDLVGRDHRLALRSAAETARSAWAYRLIAVLTAQAQELSAQVTVLQA